MKLDMGNIFEMLTVNRTLKCLDLSVTLFFTAFCLARVANFINVFSKRVL